MSALIGLGSDTYGCQVGITTDLERRMEKGTPLIEKPHISTHYTKTAAQKREMKRLRRVELQGTRTPPYVYYFEY